MERSISSSLPPAAGTLQVATGSLPALPRGPVLDWSSFQRTNAPGIHSVENLPNVLFTTSGRGAIYQALLLLKLAPGSTVLVPTYHCPTMVAPVLLAQLTPAYFPISDDGLPMVEGLAPEIVAKSKAMIVAHYFGLPRSLAKVRAWCDAYGIALIEDCAHCYFGEAGERPVGAWGDFATASLSKFFPVPEAGLVASAHRRIEAPPLERPPAKLQLKGWVDVLEFAAKYQRLAGLNRLLSPLFGLKNARAATPSMAVAPGNSAAAESDMMRDCDMGRIRQKPLWAAMTLKAVLPRGRVILQRQRNYRVYGNLLINAQGARPLLSLPSSPVAPYVFPLWVDDADRIYHALKALSLPVFRWDRIWPGTPCAPDDAGPQWSRHVLQLLCHQDLSEADIVRIATATLQLLAETHPRSSPPPA